MVATPARDFLPHPYPWWTLSAPQSATYHRCRALPAMPPRVHWPRCPKPQMPERCGRSDFGGDLQVYIYVFPAEEAFDAAGAGAGELVGHMLTRPAAPVMLERNAGMRHRLDRSELADALCAIPSRGSRAAGSQEAYTPAERATASIGNTALAQREHRS